MVEFAKSLPEAHSDIRDVEHAVAELAELSKAAITLEKLAARLLDRTVGLLAAKGGTFWLVEKNGDLKALRKIERDPIQGDNESFRSAVRDRTFRSGTLQISEFPSVKRHCESHAILLVSPIRSNGVVVGVIELLQRGNLEQDAIQGNVRFLELACQAAGDFLERNEFRSLREEVQRQGRLITLSQLLQHSLDLTQVAATLTNESRRLLECDRVSLALSTWGGYRLISVSGAKHIERRSNSMRRLEHLIAAVANTNDVFWFSEELQNVPPQIQRPLEQYLCESHVRGLGIVPLLSTNYGRRSSPFAAFVVEQYNRVSNDEFFAAVKSIAEIGRCSLLNAVRYRSLPTLPFFRGRDSLIGPTFLRSMSFWALIAGVIAVASLFLVSADFSINVRGELQPFDRREAFAPMDGQVTHISVQHGDQVKAGQPLLELSNTQLDSDTQRLQGEYETNRKRLTVIESTLLQGANSKERINDRTNDLSAEREELIKLINSVRLQLDVLAKDREKLIVRSPIDGEVLTWDLQRLLSDRPVERGQSLVSVGALSGKWVAEVQIPDNRIGYILEAAPGKSNGLPASLQLASDRQHQFDGFLNTISKRAESSEDHHGVVKAVIDFSSAQVHDLRPGATVFARLHCGRQPLGYVWFYELIELLRGWKFYLTA